MERLTRAEEPIMKIIWDKGEVFIKDIIEALSEKIPYNTVSSIVRVLESKNMVGHKAYGRTYQYYPLIKKSEYRKSLLKTMIFEYFDGSYKGLLSQMIANEDLSKDELEEMKKLLNEKS
ncbi:MAG: BlaI/MecI/CopY family transcriptional regulator [Cytophagales bacterium]|nr:BlaI/MecI/CopY family transcriptional regulator [Cytophagales bacterium]